MTGIITSLAEISDRYDVLFCDIWGCVHDGRQVFPAAARALQAFRQNGARGGKGGKVVLVTNSPRPKPAVVDQLDGLGLSRDSWDEIVTSGDAAQFGLVTGAVGRRVYHIGADKDETFFTHLAPDLAEIAAGQKAIERVALKEAEGIVCTGLRDDLNESPDDYRTELLLAKQFGLRMLCANPDIVVDHGGQRLWCAGALAQLYEEMGGHVLYFGKPHPPIYDLARRRLMAFDLGRQPEILCIGDGIGTDVQGAMGEGLDILFITSGIDREAFGTDSARPDPARLRDWLVEHQLSPLYAMGHLA